MFMFVLGIKSGREWEEGYSDFARHGAAFNIQNMNIVIPLLFFLHRKYLNLPKQVDFFIWKVHRYPFQKLFRIKLTGKWNQTEKKNSPDKQGLHLGSDIYLSLNHGEVCAGT